MFKNSLGAASNSTDFLNIAKVLRSLFMFTTTKYEWHRHLLSMSTTTSKRYSQIVQSIDRPSRTALPDGAGR